MGVTPPKRFDDLSRWLPGLLHERLRIGTEQAFNLTGDFILYWMHSTLRLRENPALDLACLLEERCGKPLVVLLTVAVDMPGASERSLLFLRQGALEVQAEAVAQGLPFEILHDKIADLEKALAKVASKAVAVVTDDTAALWQMKLAGKIGRQSHAPILSVDNDGLIPRAQLERFNFADFGDYCKKTEYLRAEYVGKPWRALQESAKHRKRPDSFLPGNTPESAIEWLANLPLNHALGPIWHKQGGGAAAQRLWQEIRPSVLRTGDPSRFAELIPYLRFGMIAPQRIAFDALLEGTPAAQKFLEATILLRDYASVFCARQPLHASSHSLPIWARQSLQQMPATVAQPLLLMANAKTQEPQWDALQKIFLQEGILPASGYDFWCKRLLISLPVTERNVEGLLKFYSQFALNSDDAWILFQMLRVLGLEQNPASRTSPVYGLLTPPADDDAATRAGAQSAARLLLPPKTHAIAVIGAGISGLACARQLVEDGYHVSIFEQEQVPGGRAATWRIGQMAFDIGAPLLTAKSQNFRDITESWKQMKLLQVWNSKIYVRDKDAGLSLSKDPFVPVPGMDALSRHLATGLDVTYGVRIDKVAAVSGGWRMTDAQGQDRGFYDAVIFAVPPIAAKAVEGMPEITQTMVKRMAFFPVWVAMLAFRTPLAIPYDLIAVAREVIRYAFRESEKPDRVGHELWVLHSAPEWALSHSGLRNAVAATKLCNEFLKIFNIDPHMIKPDYATAVLWPRAMVVRPLGQSHIWYPSRLAFCGDWCLGRRIEDAYLSGIAAAARVRNELR